MLISSNAYAIAWVVYVVCFVIGYVAFTRLTLGLRPDGLRQFLKGLVLVLFLTPVATQGYPDWYVPAWLEGGYEAILGDTAAAANAFFNLSVAAVGMIVILIVDALWRRRRGKAQVKAEAQS